MHLVNSIGLVCFSCDFNHVSSLSDSLFIIAVMYVGSVLPDVEIQTTQQVTWPPYLDALNMKLTCKAKVKSGHGPVSFVNIKWTGVGLQKSIWVKQSNMVLSNNNAEIHISFVPWLVSQAGMYTCHVVAKGEQSRIFMVEKTVEVKSKYYVQYTTVIHSYMYNKNSGFLHDVYVCMSKIQRHKMIECIMLHKRNSTHIQFNNMTMIITTDVRMYIPVFF